MDEPLGWPDRQKDMQDTDTWRGGLWADDMWMEYLPYKKGVPYPLEFTCNTLLKSFVKHLDISLFTTFFEFRALL